MAGIKGVKPKKTLTDEQKTMVESILEREGSQILDISMISELGLTRLEFQRRKGVSGYNIKIGKVLPTLKEVLKLPNKTWIELDCHACKSRFISQPITVLPRKCNNINMCGKCAHSWVCSSIEWQNNQRKIQTTAQIKPATLEKQRASQKKRFQDPKVLEHYKKIGESLWARPGYREKVSSALREKWKDPEYAQKVAWNGRSKYQGKYEGLLYQSLTELSFILWQKDIERYSTGAISYERSDGLHSYYPDFKIGTTIIEVKGSLKGYYGRQTEIIRLKQKAAEIFCKSKGLSYRIVVGKEIPKNYLTSARRIHAKTS
jgi:hypothetical protein